MLDDMETPSRIVHGARGGRLLGLGGAAVAGAAGGDGDADQALTGATATRAAAAAQAAVGAGKVVESEVSDEGGAAAYEVKVLEGGQYWEVQVGNDFSV